MCEASVAPPLPLGLSPRTVAYRGLVTISGELGGRAGQPVRIQYRRRRACESLAVVTTGEAGAFRFSFRAGSSRSYRALAPGGRATRVGRMSVRPRVASFVRRRGRRLAVHARVTPMKRRLVFRAERLTGGRWRTAAREEVRTARGRAAAQLRLSRPGRYRVRVLSRGDGRHAAGRSHTRTLTVR